MTALKIISALLGVAFTSFGYLIFFGEKYSLINGFDEAFREGRKNERYARRVGLIEFTAGIVILIGAALLIAFC